MGKLGPSSLVKTVLVGLASYGVIELSTFYLIPEWIKNYSACYKEAMEYLRQHPEAVKLLGEPIKEGRINFSNHEENNANTDMSWYTVPVEGPKSSGKMRYWMDSAEDSSDRMLRVVRIELETNALPDKILLIKHVRE